jgi:hypothetical protein
VILLGEVAARSETITIACWKCPRHGVLHTDRLMRGHSPQGGTVNLSTSGWQ